MEQLIKYHEEMASNPMMTHHPIKIQVPSQGAQVLRDLKAHKPEVDRQRQTHVAIIVYMNYVMRFK